MFKHVFHKIINKKRFYLYHMIYIVFTFSIVFLIFGFRNASIGLIEDQAIFNKDAILFTYGTTSVEFQNGIHPTDQEVSELNSLFDTITIQSNTDISVVSPQNINVVASTRDFITTGVLTTDYNKQKVVVQKVDLLYGNIWDKNSDDSVTVIDLDTAVLLFGYENVVGETINDGSNRLEIIGVVSNTISRSQLIEKSVLNGESINEREFSTTVYIPYSYYESLARDDGFNKSLIFLNKEKDINTSKRIILETLNITPNNLSILHTREDLIDAELISRAVFYQMIVSIISVLTILGIINLINVSTFTYISDKKTVGVYKVVGANTKDLALISSLESLTLGIFSSFTAIVLSLVILLIGTIINRSISFINYIDLISTAFIMTLVVVLVIWIINMISVVINHFINPKYFLRG